VTAFFDTSAIVPLILREPHSQAARTAWETAEECFAWKWLKVETEAALVRRKASAPAWQLWRTIEASMSWVEPDGDWIEGGLINYNTFSINVFGMLIAM
jgi:uncharacterized protein with PIN domain